MDKERVLKEAKVRITRYMYRSGKDAAEIASELHPDLAAEDVKRFLSGDDPVCEDERVLSVDAIMLKFAVSLGE
jgi:hypothetical protein